MNITPVELYIVVLTVANVAGNIEILAADVGSGVEEVHEVAAADDRADDFFFWGIHAAQDLRAGVSERQQRGVGSIEFSFRVRQQQLVSLILWCDVYPQDLGVGNLRTAIATTHALDERRPRRKFRDKQAGGDIHASLDGLRSDDDAVAFAKQELRDVDGRAGGNGNESAPPLLLTGRTDAFCHQPERHKPPAPARPD